MFASLRSVSDLSTFRFGFVVSHSCAESAHEWGTRLPAFRGYLGSCFPAYAQGVTAGFVVSHSCAESAHEWGTRLSAFTGTWVVAFPLMRKERAWMGNRRLLEESFLENCVLKSATIVW